MLVSIVGAGYVGLVTAACLASLGHEVRCIEIDELRLQQLRRAEIPIDEPDLPELVGQGVAAGRLTFHAGSEATVGTQLVIIAVGTLDEQDRWTSELVRGAVLKLAREQSSPRQIVIRSTLMPGTSDGIALAAKAIDATIEVAHNPEFTREGSAVPDFLRPDRVVIGVEGGDAEAAVCRLLAELYAPIGAQLVITDMASAETIKVGSNVFLATKIAFANELARLCAATGADIQTVVDAIGLDRRIGRAFFSPGPGFGGACLPSQARALPTVATSLAVRTPLIDAIGASNDEAADWLVRRLRTAMDGSLTGKLVALLGVTFKAGTDDLRESPALRLARLLASQGAQIQMYDPSGAERAAAELAAGGVAATAWGDVRQAATGADVVLVATEWPEFRSLDWQAVARVMRGRLVADARNVVDRAAITAADLDLWVLGRGYEGRTGKPAPSPDPSSRAAMDTAP